MTNIDLQIASKHSAIPNHKQFQQWANEALSHHDDDCEVCIRIVNKAESQKLNARYRHIDKATNILSFPYEFPEVVQLEKPLLGDLVICAPIIAQEAQVQQKPIEAHWAHMTLHGILHLLGFDHQNEAQANIMEHQEIRLLQKLNFANPYEEK
ncbi:MAG: rRNA maturation RNase YbeY [Gammaproteobacteria bacterium]